MKQRISLLWETLVGGILSLLGFSGCNAIENMIDPPVEYGVPTASYKLVGDVSDTEGKAIEGIRVIFAPHGKSEVDIRENDTLHTDDKGHFELERARYSFGDLDSGITFLADDVDGEENGSYQSKEVVGKDKIKITTLKNGERWFQGEFEISTHITLEEKQEEGEEENAE